MRRRTELGPDWRIRAPRWLLVLAAIAAGAYEVRWRGGVNDHISRAEDPQGGGYMRLKAVETATGITRDEVRALREEMRDSRRDQLEQYRWAARNEGDAARTREIEARLRALEQEKGQP
jgi:hypothetical protein